MSGTGKLKVDQLFKGLTRPTMLLGVTYTFAILNFMVCSILYVLTKEFKYFGALIIFHGVGYVICFYEPLFVELIMVKLNKCTRCRNRFFHGANSYEVL